MTEQPQTLTKELKLEHWGPGEWVDEPDTFIFEHLGFKCLGRRFCVWDGHNNDHLAGGYWCGYIEIPEGHPWYMKDARRDLDIDCHWGISFSEYSEEERAHLIGFDCAHSGDYVPSIEIFKRKMRDDPTNNHYLKLQERTKEMLKEFPESPLLKQFFNPTYRNMAFVIDECRKRAQQAKDAMEEKK